MCGCGREWLAGSFSGGLAWWMLGRVGAYMGSRTGGCGGPLDGGQQGDYEKSIAHLLSSSQP